MNIATSTLLSTFVIAQATLISINASAQTVAPAATISVTPELLSRRGAVLDQSTGLVWARCLVGQQWDGKGCVGAPQPFSGRAAADFARTQKVTYAGLAGWTVPTIAELVTLRKCSTGSNSQKSSNDAIFIPSGTGGPDLKVIESCSSPEAIAVDAATLFTPKPVGDGVNPSDQLVTYSYRNQSQDAWYMEIQGGRIFNYDSQLTGYVRLVLREIR